MKTTSNQSLKCLNNYYNYFIYLFSIDSGEEKIEEEDVDENDEEIVQDDPKDPTFEPDPDELKESNSYQNASCC